MTPELLIPLLTGIALILVGLIIRGVGWAMRAAVRDMIKSTLFTPNGGNSLADIRGVLDKQNVEQAEMRVMLKSSADAHERMQYRVEGISRHVVAIETRMNEHLDKGGS